MADATFPVPYGDVERQVRFIIERDGLDKLKSTAVRAHLKEHFNTDFSVYRHQVDDVIKGQIQSLAKDKEAPKSQSTEKEKPKPKPNVLSSDSDVSDIEDSKPTVSSAPKAQNNKRKLPSPPVSVKKEEEDDEEHDLSSSVKKRRRAATKAYSNQTFKANPSKKKGTISRLGRFSRLYYASDELFDITQKRYVQNQEVIKILFKYVADNNLKHPKDGRKAICDEKLQRLLKVKNIRMFGVMKFLAGKHIQKPESLGPEIAAEAKRLEAELVKEINAKRTAENGDEEKVEDGEEEEEKKEEEDGEEEEDDEDDEE